MCIRRTAAVFILTTTVKRVQMQDVVLHRGNLSLLLGGRLGDLSGGISLLHRLDDTDGNGLLHVTDSEATQGRVAGESLHAHGLAGDEVDHGGISGLDELGVVFELLAGTTIALLLDLVELAGNVGGVAIQHRCVAGLDLTRVVQDDDLSVEHLGGLGGIVLAVAGNVATTDFLDGDVLDVESDVVTGEGLGKRLVVHLHGLDFSGDVGRGEGHHHTGLDDTGLNTAHGHCSNTADLVDVLEGQTQGLVGGTGRGQDGVEH